MLLMLAMLSSASTINNKLSSKQLDQSQLTRIYIPTAYNNDVKAEMLYPTRCLLAADKASSDNVRILVKRDCNNDQLYIWTYYFMDEQMNSYVYNGGSGGGGYLTLPKGVYDVAATYIADATKQYFVVIHEQVSINNDTTVSINPAEATVHIQFEPHLPNGEKCYPETRFLDDNGGTTLVSEGNVAAPFFSSKIIFKDGTFFTGLASLWAYTLTGQKEWDYTHFQDIHINEVSNRFKFCCSMNFADYEYSNNFYTVDFEVSSCKDTIVANQAEDYLLYEKLFKQTPYGIENRPGLNAGSLVRVYSEKTPGVFGGTDVCYAGNWTLAENEPVKYYICNSHEDTSPLTTFLFARVGDMPTPWDPNTNFCTIDMPITLRDGQFFHANLGLFAFGEDDLCPAPDTRDGYSYYHPWTEWVAPFSYPIEKMKTVSGNSCPILVPAVSSRLDEERNLANTIYCGGYSIGRNGELRETDMIASHTSVKVDGAMFADVNGVFPYNWTKNEASQGIVDITVTDENVDVDGIPGRNITITHFDMAADDNTPPSLKMLDFRDAEDNVIDRFTTANEGTLQFYCGDFNAKLIEGVYLRYFDCNGLASIEVSYSPYQAEEWTALDVSEITEFYSDYMGFFYAGSLASVNQTSENGWFDLKFRLVDEAGNWQEQTLSPAFRIDALVQSAVTEVKTDHTATDTAIYNLAGQRMHGDLNSLPHGIYIVGGKKVVK